MCCNFGNFVMGKTEYSESCLYETLLVPVRFLSGSCLIATSSTAEKLTNKSVIDLVNLEFSAVISIGDFVVAENLAFGIRFENVEPSGNLVSAVGDIFRL